MEVVIINKMKSFAFAALLAASVTAAEDTVSTTAYVGDVDPTYGMGEVTTMEESEEGMDERVNIIHEMIEAYCGDKTEMNSDSMGMMENEDIVEAMEQTTEDMRDETFMGRDDESNGKGPRGKTEQEGVKDMWLCRQAKLMLIEAEDFQKAGP